MNTKVSLPLSIVLAILSQVLFPNHQAVVASVVELRHHSDHHGLMPSDNNKASICDGLPKHIPADTNTTSYLCVDKHGCCNFTTVQSAVDAVGNFSQKRSVILINSGTYYEKVIVAKTKVNVTFKGQGYEITAITWNDTALSANGTFYSGTVQVFASNFVAKNISFMNIAPIPQPGAVGAQAVAIRVGGDQAVFLGCGFFGAQDTLHDDTGRHYFKDCHIQGSIDFIFGNARSLYQDCRLISIANPVAPGSNGVDGAVTAHGRASKDENTGFSFVNCSIGGTGRIWLGRAWGNYSRVIFASTFMTDVVSPEGWNNFNDPTREPKVFYGEYNCSGPGADTSKRVPYAQKLNHSQVASYIDISYIDGDEWLPFSDI